MKRLFTLLLISLAALSCEMIDEKLDDLLDKRDWVVFAEGTELTVDVPSKQTVLNYKFESTLDWEVKTEAEWLEIDPMSGKAGKDIKIQIKVLHNKGKEARTGYADITLSNDESYRITINQAGEGDENEDIVVDIPNNQIWYTSTDGEIVEPYSGEYNEYAEAITTFGVNIVSNTYVDGKGVIEFDGDVTTIGDVAFYECSSLTSITIPDSVTTIGGSAFRGCSSLESVTIPDSVTTIGSYAFYKCSSLTSVYCKATTPPVGGYDMFSYNASGRKIYVPTEAVEAYKSASYWSDYADRIVAEEGAPEDMLISIIRYTTTDSTIVTPQNMNIKSNTYVDGEGVLEFYGDTIGDYAFLGCSNLTSVTIGDSVTEIGYCTFYDCTSLESVTIGNGVTAIGVGAFYNCTSLTSVAIPDSVTTIGYSAFDDCSSLTSVCCKAITPPAGDDYMFSNNASGRKIYVPMESVEAYKSASYWSEYADDIVGYDF